MDNLEPTLKQIGQAAQNIHLTSEEKHLQRGELTRRMNQIDQQFAGRPASSTNPLISFLHHLRPAYIAATLTLALGTGVVFASQYSLPGDLLYPLKTNVIEKVQKALATTHEEKAEVEQSLAVRRLEEAESLVKKNRLSEQAREQVATQFKESRANLSGEIDQLKKENKNALATNLSTKFNHSLQEHQQILNEISPAEDLPESLKPEYPSTEEVQNNTERKPVETVQPHQTEFAQPKADTTEIGGDK